MIENAQINYIGTVGSSSKKGFYSYKNFLSRMESRKHIEENNMKESTVWDKIHRFKERGN